MDLWPPGPIVIIGAAIMLIVALAFQNRPRLVKYTLTVIPSLLISCYAFPAIGSIISQADPTFPPLGRFLIQIESSIVFFILLMYFLLKYYKFINNSKSNDSISPSDSSSPRQDDNE
jgi:hypothetical protein